MSDSEQQLRRKDRIGVRREGEEIEVFNWATVIQEATVRASNPVVDRGSGRVYAGDSSIEPDAVTHWVADEIARTFSVDVTDKGIEVVDVTSDEVDVL